MNTSRRMFLRTAGIAGCASSMLGIPASAGTVSSEIEEKNAILREILTRPVLKRELFASPVIIKSVELLQWEGSFLCRVRSADGAEGISVAHGDMKKFFPIFLHNLQPFFVEKDARELDLILEKVYIYGFNFRLNGIALGLPLATIEFAILDMLGHIAGLSIGRLLGEIHNPEVPVYIATEWRERPLDETVERIKEAVSEFDVRALKIKVGYLMFMTKDMRAKEPVGKTEKLIPVLREHYGSDMALYADANGYYSVEEAIRVGRLLEEYNYMYFEEPVMFDDFEAVKKVAEALTIPIATGEQEQSFVHFRWFIANDVIGIVQPDNYYFGGFIRCIKVGRMAAAFGKSIAPHMSGGGLGFLYNSHLVSVLPNAAAHHEFKGLRTNVPYECKTSSLKVVDGAMKVPTGPGSGVDLDPDFIGKHRLVTA